MPGAGTAVGATILPAMDLGEPVSYLVVEPGTDVYSADGARVGTLQHVLADEENDIFDGIVIDTERGPGALRFADAPDVDELWERVEAAYTVGTLEELQRLLPE